MPCLWPVPATGRTFTVSCTASSPRNLILPMFTGPCHAELSAIPTVLYGTINGVIGVVASLPHATYQLLESLQVGHD